MPLRNAEQINSFTHKSCASWCSPELEKARQAKTIGKALEAKVILTGNTPLLTDGKIHLAALRELLHVSQMEIPLEGNTEVAITVAHALGQKCERCWHWEIDVGEVSAHPTICGRCVAAISTVVDRCA